MPNLSIAAHKFSETGFLLYLLHRAGDTGGQNGPACRVGGYIVAKLDGLRVRLRALR